MKRVLFLVSLFVFNFAFGQAPPNDNCITPQVIVIPASGTICVNSTNINATSDGFLNTCDVGVPGNEVWFAFVATGTSNTVTITPNGGTPAQFAVVSMQNTNCASGSYNICNASATAGGAASVTYSYTPGSQILFSVETEGADGTFQVCVTSTTPPPGPGSSCATATSICTMAPFTQNPMPSNVTALLPSCFFVNLQQPVFYQFTAGTTGTCAWSATPLGAVEYDWAMYNITAGCPGVEVACNYDYNFSAGSPVGMAIGSPSLCPTSSVAVSASDEMCPPIVVTAGQTYLIVIDNFDFNGIGFDFAWGNGTFQMPSSSFTVNPTNACNSALATFVNNSVPVAAASHWDFGDGTTSNLHSPPPHNYPTPGTYLISLTTTTANGCQYISSNSVTVNTTPTMTTPPNISVCAGTAIAASNFVSNPTGATFAWTNSNNAIGLAANGTGNTPAFTSTNGTGSNIVSTITVTPTRNGCAGTPVNYTITVTPGPTIANAGPAQSVCGTTATLAGNTATTGVGTWTLVSGAGTITNPNSPTSGVTGLGVGANVFQWTIISAPCPNSTSQVTITSGNATSASVAGPNQTVCGTTATLAGNAPAVGVGTWTLVSGAGTITTPGSPTSGLTALGVGANVFQWTITNAGCPSTSSQVTITAGAIPTVAVAGGNQIVCGTTATLGGNTATVGVGTWTLVSGAGTITSPNSPSSGVTALGPGANVFQWTIALLPCPATSSQVTITSVQVPTVAAAGPNQTVCGTNATLAGNVAAIGTGLWTVVSGSGTIANTGLNNSAITALGAGANVFQWTISNAPCASTSGQVTITGVTPPTVAAAGPNQTVCGTTATLAGNLAASGTGLWTLISGTGTITTPSSETSGLTALGVGANVFQWTISNAPCPTSTSQVTITGVAVPTVAVTGPNQTVCATTTNLAGNIAAAGSGLWTLVSGAGTITTPASESTGITALGIGANVFQWTISNAPCPSTSSQVTITAGTPSTVAAAGPNQTVCGTSATLAGNAAVVGVGVWTLVSGSGTITNPTLPNSGVTGLGFGANVFQWEIDNLPCPPSTSQVTITAVDVPTVSVAGPNQNICGTTATLAGNAATTGTGLWTLVSGSGTISTPSLATSGITGLTVGNNVFDWTISNAPCPASSTQVTIAVSSIPTVANAGPNQTVCGTTATLAGNTATTGVGTWTLISGAGTITNPALENSGVTGLGPGANVFQWQIDLLPCPQTTSQVTITSVATPTVAAAGPNQTVCGTTATLAGNLAAVGTGVWTLVSGTGTITNTGLNNSGITALGAGANVFQWTISNAPCPASTSQVTITGVSIPTVANAGANQTVCGTNATLAGNAAAVGTGAWTVVSGSGTFTNSTSETSGITALGVGANVFEWTISNGICPPTSSQVTITGVATPTVAAAGPNQTICATTATLAGNIATTGTGVWTVVSGAGTITNPASPTSGVTGLTVGTDVFQWTITNAPCPASSSQVTITVGAPTTIANAGVNQNVCGTTATLAGNVPVTGTGAWTVVSGGATVTSPLAFNSGVTNLAPGANVFEWTISSANCPPTTSQVTITATPIPPAPVVVSPLNYCQFDVAGVLSATGTNLLWYTNSTGGVGSPIAPTPSTTLSGTTNYYVSQTINGCEGPRTFIAVIVATFPVASFYAPLTSSIENPVIHFTDESVGATSWSWNFGDFSSGANNTSTSQNPTHAYGAVGSYCINLIAANGVCIDSTTLCLVINPLFTFYVPNAFTPNEDGINDEFFGKGENIKEFEMSIYDRWGNLIFYGDDISKHWLGNVHNGNEIAQEDVYVYVIKIKDNMKQDHKYIGSVSLVK